MKGWKTVMFGALLVVAPPLVQYIGGVDWTAFGLSPAAASVIGLVVIGLRAVTNTAIGQKS
jgi:sorbitol-specific phosphotransferase system component IIBC